MYRLKTMRIALVLLIGVTMFSCAKTKPIIRDQLIVEKLRLRITKVRNAAAETRAVIAASRGAPYLAEIHMRLAELQSEEARYHYMVAYEREQQRSKSLHVPQVRFLKEQAINTYSLILQRYPETHLADRILFNISHELRELGRFDEMLTYLERLVKEHPNSPYRNEALLVLGDYYFDKVNFVDAEKYFQEIIATQAGPLLGLANYKLAWVKVNLGDCKAALTNFEQAILFARETEKANKNRLHLNGKSGPHQDNAFEIPKLLEEEDDSFAGHKALNVQYEALVDLTYCYAQERKPEEAVGYLKTMANTREGYVAALAKMATRYAIIEQPRGAAEVARELLRLAPDDAERLDDARMLHNSVTRMKDYSLVGEDVYLILRAMRRQLLKLELKKEAANLLKSELEMIARDLATKSHEVLLSKGATKSEWTKNPADADQTARAYLAYLDALPDSKNRLEIVQNLADVLSESGRFLEAGHRYREAAAMLKAPPEAEPSATGGKTAEPADRKQQRLVERREALFNAVVAYQSSLDTEVARGHMERVTARAGLRRSGGEYLAEGATDKEKAQKIKFAIAQSYYDEGRYLEAINLLTAVAFEYPGTKQGDAAVHMVMDSLMTINDISGMIDAGRRFMAKGTPFSDTVKQQIAPIVTAAEQRRLDELSLEASGDRAGGMETLLAFAERYKNSSLGERAMLSAFIAARASGDVDSLYAMGEQVMAKYPASEQIAGVVSTMGSTAAARFEFSRAIQYFEQSANMNTDQKDALLLAAGQLREQLADREGALTDYRNAVAAAGEGPRRVEAASCLADLIERGGTPEAVVKELRPLAVSRDPEITSRLGLALLRMGRKDEAEELLRNVVEGGTAASAEALARANYGMAEIMLKMLMDFTPSSELDTIEEAIGLVDVVLQAYLSAARQPDRIYSQAALARLARAAEVGAEKLESITLPSELSEQERTAVQQAMTARAAQLKSDRQEALKECAARAKTLYLMTEAGRSCIIGVAPKEDPVRFLPLAPRGKPAVLKNVEEARERLAKNPDDLDALRQVGLAFLNAGDPHAARLVLGRTAETGGGAEDLNVLGVACYRAGDLLGALDAFGRAKEAGSAAAFRNLSAVYNKLGLLSLSKEVLDGAPTMQEGLLIAGTPSNASGGGK